MTNDPSLPADRRVPDTFDLRLLAELTRSTPVGLAQAAWQAGMSQTEAAARLVTMNEAGMPLRLVAEGDPAALWQIMQRGPVRQPGAPSEPPQAQPTQPAHTQPGYAVGGPSPESMWGIPGTATWANRADSATGAQVAPAQPPAAPPPAERRWVPVGSPQPATGLSGEQLTVTVAEVIDPGNDILNAAGFRLDDTERAVLVRTTIANAGPAPHDCMPDLYLFLMAADGSTLPKAPVAIAGRPAHRVGVAAGASVEGWTIFLIAADAELIGVRWCVRPDLSDRALTWSLTPLSGRTGVSPGAGPPARQSDPPDSH